MKVKVSEATTLQLDWMVAKCECIEVMQGNSGILYSIKHHTPNVYSPSQYWVQGGPIIDREDIDTYKHITTGKQGAVYATYTRKGWHRQFGETKLVAGMRCYVASKLGEEIEVPDELME